MEINNDLKNVAVGTRFWTCNAYMDYAKPRASITQWELVSPEHGVAVLIGYDGQPISSHTTIIDQKEYVFYSASDAWKKTALKLQSIVETIQAKMDECLKNAA